MDVWNTLTWHDGTTAHKRAEHRERDSVRVSKGKNHCRSMEKIAQSNYELNCVYTREKKRDWILSMGESVRRSVTRWENRWDSNLSYGFAIISKIFILLNEWCHAQCCLFHSVSTFCGLAHCASHTIRNHRHKERAGWKREQNRVCMYGNMRCASVQTLKISTQQTLHGSSGKRRKNDGFE